MALQNKNIKGLQDIRTLAGRVDQASIPYKAFMKLGALEMEKYRRGEEKMSAMNRIENIDARFKEIENEKTGLLEVLKEQDKNCRPKGVGPAEPIKPQTRRSTGGFKIRY
jgi:hypothetical protein